MVERAGGSHEVWLAYNDSGIAEEASTSGK